MIRYNPLMKKENYINLIEKNYPETYNFLQNKNIKKIKKLNSRWRQNNLVLKLNCQNKNYIFKRIAAEDEYPEISRARELRNEYPSLFPKLFTTEKDSYLMEFIEGKTFFDLTTKQKINYTQKAGAKLNKDYIKINGLQTSNLTDYVTDDLKSKFEKANAIIPDLKFPLVNLEKFKEVPNQQCHGDLNAANLIYGDNIKMIDPATENFGDVARDIGRYCASIFFNHYDYFGNDKKESLKIADDFLGNFDNATLQRTKYHIGASFLSFIKYHTKTTPKSVLGKLATNLLEKEGNIVNLLEESL